MRVSVIIPAYNEEILIGCTLASLKKQDFRDEMEIIVVDNNCSDGTAEVAEHWGARVVRETHQGYVYALIRGSEEATGEILVFTDADTIVPEDWISSFVRAFESDSRVVAVGSMVDYYDTNWRGDFFNRCILPFALFYERLCFPYPHLWGATMAVRKDAFLKIGGWDGKFNLQADADLTRRLARIGKIKKLKSLKVSTSARRWNNQLISSTLVQGINFLGLQLLHRSVFFNFPAIRVILSNPNKRRSLPRRKWKIPSAIGLFVALLSLGIFFTACPSVRAFGKTYSHVPTHDKVIALTFDDGPNEPYTSEILNILRESRVRATFFLIGANVKYYPNVAREIVMEGHEIGNHSYSHPFFLALEGSRNEDRQIDLAEETIEKTTGVHCSLFRPPYGIRSPWLLKNVEKRGLTCVEWSESGIDWNNVTSVQIAEKVIVNARPGNIILLHDGMRLKHGADQSKTVNALPTIIATLRAEGYRFMTISELLRLVHSTSHQ